MTGMRAYHFRPAKRLCSAFPSGYPGQRLESIVLEDIYALTLNERRHEVGRQATHSVIRSEVIDLLLPARTPEVLADELDGVEGVREEAAVMAQACTACR